MEHQLDEPGESSRSQALREQARQQPDGESEEQSDQSDEQPDEQPDEQLDEQLDEQPDEQPGQSKNTKGASNNGKGKAKRKKKASKKKKKKKKKKSNKKKNKPAEDDDSDATICYTPPIDDPDINYLEAYTLANPHESMQYGFQYFLDEACDVVDDPDPDPDPVITDKDGGFEPLSIIGDVTNPFTKDYNFGLLLDYLRSDLGYVKDDEEALTGETDHFFNLSYCNAFSDLVRSVEEYSRTIGNFQDLFSIHDNVAGITPKTGNDMKDINSTVEREHEYIRSVRTFFSITGIPDDVDDYRAYVDLIRSLRERSGYFDGLIGLMSIADEVVNPPKVKNDVRDSSDLTCTVEADSGLSNNGGEPPNTECFKDSLDLAGHIEEVSSKSTNDIGNPLDITEDAANPLNANDNLSEA
ncbi:hypothetical protein F53441_2777 [Fusarium austroafricanum]|uniref:Uncharacterized protein n=1 Tax=Fusarium austroafricanum TaxID=2364996 RepID=A0A8H4KS13_9HYPO|nr:hypothetical protein F53441_2777 [Fusarium austroafricanum]